MGKICKHINSVFSLQKSWGNKKIVLKEELKTINHLGIPQSELSSWLFNTCSLNLDFDHLVLKGPRTESHSSLEGFKSGPQP